jgi:NADPH:quinone reductase-like Zn-dependent oxidoreductase
VTGVCSTRNVELVRSIGADHVVDYTKEDFTEGRQRYDVVLDNVGNRPLSACVRVLVPGGVLIPNSGDGGRWFGPLGRMLRALAVARATRRRPAFFVTQPDRKSLETLRDLLEAGKITPVIDRTYPLGELPAALTYLEAGHARGKVVVTV